MDYLSCTNALHLRYDSRSAFLFTRRSIPMKTLFKIVFVLALALGVSSLLMAQTKSGDRSKKTTGANSAAPQASADKKPAAEGEKAASTTPTKLEDNKSKDPLENVKFRNLGP